MIKKFLLSLAFLLIPIFALSTTISQPVFAADDDNCQLFLGLKAWYCGVNTETISSQEELQSNIWLIGANVLVDISVIAAYLVVGYTIYGGYQYVLSNGDPNKVANGKKTLTQAFIGLAIVLLANIILNTIGTALGGVNFSDNCVENECVDPVTAISSAIQWVIAVVGIVAAIFVVIGGFSYITSAGDPNKLSKAKNTIMYALIGLIIVALSELIVGFVSGIITNSASSAFNNQITVAKEYHEK